MARRSDPRALPSMKVLITAPHRSHRYDLGAQTIALDVDVSWQSAIKAEVELTTTRVGARVPVSVRNLRFEGAIRLMVVGLQSSEPGYGAILVSFPSAPKVGLDLTVAGGELTKLPWLRTEVQKVRPKTGSKMPPRRVPKQGRRCHHGWRLGADSDCQRTITDLP